jgi:hypothetical protein
MKKWSDTESILRLNAILLIAACERLRLRIESRFPDTGLSRVGGNLVDIAKRTEERIRRLNEPNWPIRSISIMPMVLLAVAVGFAAFHIPWRNAFNGGDTAEMLQGIDALASLIVLLSGAIWFLVSTETRIKRREVLRGLFDLRSIAHVIDMHQLTKYPSAEHRLAPTTASMVQALSDAQLARYLDYCIEMLALIGKLAALYAEETQGQEVTSAIGDVEDLTSDLGRRIWQKIQIIDTQQE